MSTEKKREAMKKIRDELFERTDAPLYSYRSENGYFPVIGEGSHDAEVMFIGEAPGQNEAKQGRPFCGAAGKTLDELLGAIELPRENVYITNIVKDRPPGNRDPLPLEVEYYAPLLDRQIEIIEPKVIVTLGRHAMNYIMKRFDLEFELEPISVAHGKVYTAKTLFGKVKIIPQYHPAAAIYNRDLIQTLQKDFKAISEALG